jgi:hypothetical protein
MDIPDLIEPAGYEANVMTSLYPFIKLDAICSVPEEFLAASHHTKMYTICCRLQALILNRIFL